MYRESKEYYERRARLGQVPAGESLPQQLRNTLRFLIPARDNLLGAARTEHLPSITELNPVVLSAACTTWLIRREVLPKLITEDDEEFCTLYDYTLGGRSINVALC